MANLKKEKEMRDRGSAIAKNGFKTCSICKETKQIEGFWKDHCTADGFCYSCKICQYKCHKNFMSKHPDYAAKRIHKAALARLGITVEEYTAAAESQGNVCVICGNPEKIKRRLAIDHDHITGQVRGLLCGSCNGGLGLFKDQSDLLRIAANYIDRYKINH